MALEHPSRMVAGAIVTITDITPSEDIDAETHGVARMEFNTTTQILTLVPTNPCGDALPQISNTASLRRWQPNGVTLTATEQQVTFICRDLAGAPAAPVAGDVINITLWDIDPGNSIESIDVPVVT